MAQILIEYTYKTEYTDYKTFYVSLTQEKLEKWYYEHLKDYRNLLFVNRI